jgi:hypothetical protein
MNLPVSVGEHAHIDVEQCWSLTPAGEREVVLREVLELLDGVSLTEFGAELIRQACERAVRRGEAEAPAEEDR